MANKMSPVVKSMVKLSAIKTAEKLYAQGIDGLAAIEALPEILEKLADVLRTFHGYQGMEFIETRALLSRITMEAGDGGE